MNARKPMLLWGTLVTLSFNPSTDAYVIGHTKLFNGTTQTSIDLLYDQHVPSPLPINPSVALLKGDIIKNFYATEQRVMRALDYFNKQPSSAVDVVWEIGKCTALWSHCFISIAPFIIEGSYSGLNFIRSDQLRDSVESLFVRSWYLVNSVGSTRENLIPLPPDRLELISARLGSPVLSDFLHYYDDIAEKVRNYYGGLQEAVGDVHWYTDIHFNSNYIFHSLADLEMLSHILASDKKKIIVYAGGWHCGNLQHLLQGYGFGVVNSKSGYDCVSNTWRELSLSDLNDLDGQNYIVHPKPLGVLKKAVKKPVAALKKKVQGLGKKKLGILSKKLIAQKKAR